MADGSSGRSIESSIPTPGLAEASVDLEALARNALALVGRQKQRQTCDVVGRHRIGNSLTRANFSDLLLVREPQLTLALGDHHAGRDGVDANAVGPDRRARELVKPTIAAFAAA